MPEVPTLAVAGPEGRLTDAAITALARLLLMTELPCETARPDYTAQPIAHVGDRACYEPPSTSA
ncbi:hypothetical protein J0H58_16425 [bacterium]|nr:hypothetical protein [bacterium]